MRKTWMALLAAVLLVALCAGISLKNYAGKLNRVVIADTVPNQIREEYVRDGVLTFRSETVLALPEGTVIAEVYVEEGQDFKAGDPLVKLDENSVLLRLYENRVAQDSFSGYPDGAAEDLAELKLTMLQETEAQLQAILEQDCIVTAPEAGQAIHVPFAAGATAAASMTYGTAKDGYTFTWYMEPENCHSFTGGTLELSQEVLELNPKEIQAVYDTNRGRYCCSVAVDTVLRGTRIGQGAYGRVTVQYVSQEYRAVLPLSAIRTDETGGTYVYQVMQRDTLYGTEDYLRKTGVTILERDGQNAAVLASLTDVVIAANRAPQDLEAVLVIEEETGNG